MTNKEALKVLKSWLVVAYQNTNKTDSIKGVSISGNLYATPYELK